MFWALVASAIMLASGTGDDAFKQKQLQEALEEAVTQVITDPARLELALKNLHGFKQLLLDHRKGLGKAGDCIEKMDRSYKVTKQDYQQCLAGVKARWDTTEKEYIRLEKEQHGLITPEEMVAIEKIVLKELE